MCDKCEKHICKICGKEYGNRGPLAQHIKKFHKMNYLDYMVQYEGFQIPKCPICGKECKPYIGIFFKTTCGSKDCLSEFHRREIEPRKYEMNSKALAEIKMRPRAAAKNPMKNKDIVDKVKMLWVEKSLAACIERYSEDFDDIHIEGFDVVGACKKCGHIENLNGFFIWQRKYRTKARHGELCSVCNPIHKHHSLKEKDFCDMVKSLCDCEIIENDRSVIKPLELDIYIPEKNLAFEFNGNYWHSPERLKRKYKNWETYHEDKTKACADKGVKLVYVWESDWDNNREEVENKVKLLVC